MKLTKEKECILLFIILLVLFYMIKNKETIIDGMSNYMELKNTDYLITSNKQKYAHKHTLLGNQYDDASMYVRVHPGDKPLSRWHNSIYDNFY